MGCLSTNKGHPQCGGQAEGYTERRPEDPRNLGQGKGTGPGVPQGHCVKNATTRFWALEAAPCCKRGKNS